MLDIRLTLVPVPIDYMQMLLDLMEERQKWLAQRDQAIREISRLSELIRATVNMIPPEQLARYEPIFERIEQRPLGLALAIRACFTAECVSFNLRVAAAPGASDKPGIPAKPGAPSTRAVRVMGWKPVVGLEGQKPDVGLVGQKPDGGSPDHARSPDPDGWLTPVQIRDALKRIGYPFENYKANPLASIHTTLKRMTPGELEVKKLKDGQKAYRLKSAHEWQQAFAEIGQWLKTDLHVIQSPSAGVVVVKRFPGEKDEAAKAAPSSRGQKSGDNENDERN